MKQKKLFTGGISRWLLNAATLAFLSILFTLFLLPRTGFAFVEVMSGSMEPGISAGDIVLIHTHEERIREGDVISFQKGGVQMLHRVIEKNEEGFRTKGDANREPDAFFVRREEIRGVCIAAFPQGQRIFAFLRSPAFLILGLLLLILQGASAETEAPAEKGRDHPYIILPRKRRKT